MVGEPQDRGRDAGFSESGFRMRLHLPDCAVVPEFAPDVFESARSGDKQFVSDNIMEIGQRGFEQFPVSGVAVKFQQTFKAGGHFVCFPVAETVGFSACARFPEQVHGLRTAGFGKPLRESGKFRFSGQPGGELDCAENGVGGHPIVPKSVAGTFPAGETCDQVCRYAADRFKNVRIRFDTAVIAAEPEQSVFASPDVPVFKPFFRRIGAEASIRFHAAAKFSDGFADHRFQFRIGICLQNADGGPDDFPPEFAAPASIAVFMIAE